MTYSKILQETDFKILNTNFYKLCVDFWKLIIFFIFATQFVALTLVYINSDKYVASALVKSANLKLVDPNTSLIKSVEDSSQLIARMTYPSSYRVKDLESCKFSDERVTPEGLLSRLVFSEVRGDRSLIEIKVTSNSQAGSINCLQSVIDNISLEQANLVQPYIDESLNLLKKYENRVSNIQNLLLQADKSGVALSAGYLASRDEAVYLANQSDKLHSLIYFLENNRTRLIAPIYSSSYMNISRVIIFSVSGLLLGFATSLLCILLILSLRRSHVC